MIKPRSIQERTAEIIGAEMLIDAPGIYDLDAATYHSDPCATPSLSAGVAWELLTRSPLHAWAKHPRLNPDFEESDDTKFDLGTVAHTLVLGKGAEIAVIDAPDYRGKDARSAREEALAASKTPILAEQYERASRMRDRLAEQLRGHEIGYVFGKPGKAECAVIWEEDGAWCRCMPDWLMTGDRVEVFDLKTTTNAHPNVWRSRVEQIGFCFKASFYMRGIQQATGAAEVRYRWIAVEVEPPHALAVYAPDPVDLIAAEEDVGDVIAAWRECLSRDVWPGYPPKTMLLPLSGGYRMRQEARQEAGELSPAAIEQAIQWTKEMLA